VADNVINKHSILTDLIPEMMAKHIVIERPNGIVTIVRSELETATEDPLTEHEQIINELYSKVEKLGLFGVVPCLSKNQDILYGKDIIDFAMYLTGHDRETVEQMYFDYSKPK
jgi:hypothetical protein